MPAERKRSIIGKVLSGVKIKMERAINGKYQRHFCESNKVEPSHCRRLVMIECTFDFRVKADEFNNIITNWFDPHHGTLPTKLYRKMASIGVRKEHADGVRTSFRVFLLFGEDIPIDMVMKRGDPDILPDVLKMLFPLNRASSVKREIITCDCSRDVFDSHVTLHETRCFNGVWFDKDGESVKAQVIGTTEPVDWKTFRENLDWRPKYGHGTY
ncbi:hypothetical protein JMJ77_0006631 [Colletotrichum scovillei]|uniref:Uncharacterized protein n=1 Tax=Colletotrichum scovillei TaxID=1209932 RepID=A0A9P7RL12_9PEZI|nr:hypothetical protein JMJ77_0006631 [Colletotrichum scovillei]KAG7077905.1 hypothetical protein JMJ76_0015146 [Colletotrichum scovillei]KAG7085002.1 hypothetical protein JMJ78_0010432 [Colletotrichum scovillei]